MFKEGDRYWLILSPKVYVGAKDENMLLYHTENGESIETTLSVCRELVAELQKDVNLGVIEFTEDYRGNSEIVNFVSEALQKNIFARLPVEDRKRKPIVLLPILSLQWDVDKLSVYNEGYFLGRNILHYLNRLNIYLNAGCEQNCSGCDSYYKQFKACTKQTIECTMPPAGVRNVLSQVVSSSTKVINLLGGNLCDYGGWDQLWKVLDDFDFEYHLWINLKNISIDDVWVKIAATHNIDVLITPDIQLREYDELIGKLSNLTGIKFHYIVESEKRLVEAEMLSAEIGEDRVDISLFYSGSNYVFFENNVFLDKEDMFSSLVSMRAIFCNQKLNSNFFGELTILPDGDVYANVNKPVLGNVNIDPVVGFIYREILSKSAWRNTREVGKCSQCIYQYLCPPPSNYETSLERENLCKVV